MSTNKSSQIGLPVDADAGCVIILHRVGQAVKMLLRSDCLFIHRMKMGECGEEQTRDAAGVATEPISQGPLQQCSPGPSVVCCLPRCSGC